MMTQVEPREISDIRIAQGRGGHNHVQNRQMVGSGYSNRIVRKEASCNLLVEQERRSVEKKAEACYYPEESMATNQRCHREATSTIALACDRKRFKLI